MAAPPRFTPIPRIPATELRGGVRRTPSLGPSAGAQISPNINNPPAARVPLTRQPGAGPGPHLPPRDATNPAPPVTNNAPKPLPREPISPPVVPRDDVPPPTAATTTNYTTSNGPSKPLPIARDSAPPKTVPPPVEKKPDKKDKKEKKDKKTKKTSGSSDSSELEKLKKQLEEAKQQIQKFEAELKRSDDTILVQEEEIRRLADLVEVGEFRDQAKGLELDTESEADAKSGKKPKKTRSRRNVSASVQPKSESSPAVPTTRRSMEPPRTTSSRSNTTSISAGQLQHSALRSPSSDSKDAFADLSISIIASGLAGGASGTLQSHAAIVSVRSPKLKAFLAEKYTKKIPKKKGLELKGIDLNAFTHYIDYLYDESSLDTLFPEKSSGSSKINSFDVLALIGLARKFDETRLQLILEENLKKEISFFNVVPLLKQASEFKDLKIRKMCMDFLLIPDNFKEFVMKRELTNELGMDLFTELVTLNATLQASGGKAGRSDSENLRLSDYPSTYMEDFKQLFSSMLYADACVVIGGENIRFHKAILVAASKKIWKEWSKGKYVGGGMDDMSSELELSKDGKFYEKLTGEAFRGLLRYIYYGDTDIEALSACLLIPFARYYQMSELQSLCEKRIQESVSNSKVVLKILSVTYLSAMAAREDMRDKLRRDCLNQIVAHLKEVELGEIKSMDKETSLPLALDILLTCQKKYG